MNVRRIGAAAHSLLRPGQRGRVLAAFSGIIYLQTASGELVWAASGAAPMHRRCLKVTAPLPRTGTGVPFLVQGQCLNIGSDLELDCANAELWQAPAIQRNRGVESSAVPGRIRALAAGLNLAQAPGLGRLIPELVGGSPDSVAVAQDPFLAQVRPPLLDMADACRGRDQLRMALRAEALIGLGSGLTPSGDDFLGGLLFGLHTLRSHYPDLGLCSMGAITESCRLRTNSISFTLLHDLAEGHAVEPMHRIVNGILEGEPGDQIGVPIRELARAGHSTGWDMLAGFFTGLLASETSQPRPRLPDRRGER